MAVVELETRRPIIQLQGHVKAVVDVRWSRCSRFLLSASRDWNVIVWDLATGDRRDTVRFDAPLTSAVLHPRNRCVNWVAGLRFVLEFAGARCEVRGDLADSH